MPSLNCWSVETHPGGTRRRGAFPLTGDGGSGRPWSSSRYRLAGGQQGHIQALPAGGPHALVIGKCSLGEAGAKAEPAADGFKSTVDSDCWDILIRTAQIVGILRCSASGIAALTSVKGSLVLIGRFVIDGLFSMYGKIRTRKLQPSPWYRRAHRSSDPTRLRGVQHALRRQHSLCESLEVVNRQAELLEVVDAGCPAAPLPAPLESPATTERSKCR